ncbi:hypothetical protein L1856_20425 [Streptomyces sp. Tue 6430]|nr:hypothetical protein [Streptomyces sp. Tue 6430]
MDWLAPVNTLTGAAIGIGSTLLADRIRWRRDREALDRDTRRQAYAAFMAALSDAYTRLHETAGEPLPRRRPARPPTRSSPPATCTRCATNWP